jgi:hypothetical protein
MFVQCWHTVLLEESIMAYNIAIDFGYKNNLQFEVYRSDLKYFKEGYRVDLTDEMLLKTMKKNKKFYGNVVKKVTSVARKIHLDLIDADSLVILPEKQLSYDLIYLQGIVTGVLALVLSRLNPIIKAVRNMDACKYYNIPVSKKRIATSMKKKLTINKVKELTGDLKIDEHEADAKLIALYFNKV